MNLWTVFLTGLIAGGISCAAVQGGLLAGVVSRQSSTGPAGFRNDFIPVGSFLIGKLLSHAVVGAALGLLGATFQIGVRWRGLIQVAAGVMLAAFALDLLGVPVVRSILPTAPASWTRLVRRSARFDSGFAPGLLGLATILVPCGVTLSMEFLAIASGSVLSGAAIMAIYVIGTAPLFSVIGMAARRSGQASGLWWKRLTGLAVVAAAFLSINAGLVLLDSRWSPSRVWAQAVGPDQLLEAEQAGSATPPTTVSVSDGVVVGPDGIQRVTINASGDGYSPSRVRVKAGIPTMVNFHAESRA